MRRSDTFEQRPPRRLWTTSSSARDPPGQVSAGVIDVPSDLLGQRLQGRELALLAQTVEEEKPDLFPVDVRGEVEDVGLDHGCRVLVEGGADSDVGDAAEPL